MVYLLIGNRYIEMAAVSIYTLRQHYQGPVTVMTGDAPARQAIASLADDPVLDVRVQTIEASSNRRRQSYATKPLAVLDSPYRQTLLLDADTTIHGDLDDLFEAIDHHRVVLTRFSGWVTTGNIMRRRIEMWRGISPAIDYLVERALERAHPAVNTGVSGWQAESPEIEEWRLLTEAGGGRNFTDELAAQLLISIWPEATLLSDRFNASPTYSRELSTAKILHFHGRRCFRKAEARPYWADSFRAARDGCALKSWAGKFDGDVRRLLAEGVL